MNFVTYGTMAHDAQVFARTLPRDTIGVLGVPRSGMLPATIVASEIGVRLGEPFTFIASGGAFLRSGRRMSWDPGSCGTVVILDDSIYGGSAMANVLEALAAAPALRDRFRFLTAALYLEPGMEERVDLYHRVLPSPRLFAWNWLGVKSLSSAFVDMDGLLCVDPDPYDDDGVDYQEAIRHAEPLCRPHQPIGTILTGRLERWNEITRAWLYEHGVKVRQIIAAPFATAQDRRVHGVARWKASVLEEYRPPYYLESDVRLAREIADLANGVCPVVCPLAGKVFG